MTTRERMLLMFLSDEDRGITPEERKFFDHCNENYKTLFYEPWKEYMTPFRIAGNLYYLGNRLYCVHLIATEEGLILYDSGFQHTAPLIMKGILELGFRPEDVKYVIMTHGHFDHFGSAAWFQGMYGAKVCFGAQEKGRLDIPRFGTIPRDDYSCDPVEPDILIHTGDEIKLGSTVIRFYETPGHSAGSITGFFDTEENGQKIRVCMYGDAGSGGLSKERSKLPSETIDELRKIREDAFELMKKECADVFTSGHPQLHGYNLLEKREKMLANPSVNPFIDPAVWEKAREKEIEMYEDMLDREMHPEKKPKDMPF